jgi:hypothetical protein
MTASAKKSVTSSHKGKSSLKSAKSKTMKRMGSRKKSLQSNNSDINNIYQASDYMTLNGNGAGDAYGDVIAGLTPTGNK